MYWWKGMPQLILCIRYLECIEEVGRYKDNVLACQLLNAIDVPQKGIEELTGVLGNWKPGVKACPAVRGRENLEPSQKLNNQKASFKDN